MTKTVQEKYTNNDEEDSLLRYFLIRFTCFLSLLSFSNKDKKIYTNNEKLDEQFIFVFSFLLNCGFYKNRAEKYVLTPLFMVQKPNIVV